MEPECIDWDSPWFAPWRQPGEQVLNRHLAGAALHVALGERPGSPVRFVPQSDLPAGRAYEHFIFGHGACPTRDNLHDFFNGLCWLRMPRAKQRLNELQARQIARNGIGASRGPVRDAVTLFDENGALLDAPAPLWDALLERDWKRLFVELRPLWAQARVLVFGHALLEKLARPRKDLTAHVWREPCPLAQSGAADDWLARRCSPDRLASKPFTPLPVLGIPGWCPQNADISYYDDPAVFRPRR